MSQIDQKYEGYTNRETFDIANYLNGNCSDEFTYNSFLEIAKAHYDNENPIIDLADVLKGIIEDIKPAIIELLGNLSFWRINYYELAKDYYEEFKTQEEEK